MPKVMQLLSSCLNGFSACFEAERFAFMLVLVDIRCENTKRAPSRAALRAMRTLKRFEDYLEEDDQVFSQLIGQPPFCDSEDLECVASRVRAEATNGRLGEAILASFFKV